MAEIELSVLSRQCLDRRVPEFESLQAEARAWQERRQEKGSKIESRFGTDDARIKLKRLYLHYKSNDLLVHIRDTLPHRTVRYE